MTVITMTREMGSRGKDVAKDLVKLLGLQVVHKEVVEQQLAQRLQVGESLVHRYLEGDCSVFQKWHIDEKALAHYTAEQIFELAEGGNVLIRGWGATQLLRPVSHVVSVRICAPLDARIATMMGRLNLAHEKTARKEIEESDAAHTRATKRLSQTDWKEAGLYDLVLNTERIPVERCVGLVRRLVDNPSFKETPQSRATLAALKRDAQRRSLDRRRRNTPELVLSSVARHSPASCHFRPAHEDRPTSREDRELFL